MQPSATDSYRQTEILTATPQKRQLMLLDGAIRFIERTRHYWHQRQDEEACESLVRAQQILAELMAALDHRVAPKLTRRVAALYVFAFRTLVEASLHRDETKLDEALRVLRPQREAWQEACRTLGADVPLDGEAAAASLSAHDAPPKPHAEPVPPVEVDLPGEPSAGFSMEA
jgi:flagellar protein FliS